MISNETGYAPYDIGFAKDVFIKWPDRETMPDIDYEMAKNTLNMLGYVSTAFASLMVGIN